MDRELSERPGPRAPAAARGQRVALVDLLDRLLAGGVVIVGDVTISIADVDLVRISLRALVASIRPEMERAVAAEVVRDTVARPVEAEVVRQNAVRPVEGEVVWEDRRP